MIYMYSNTACICGLWSETFECQVLTAINNFMSSRATYHTYPIINFN